MKHIRELNFNYRYHFIDLYLIINYYIKKKYYHNFYKKIATFNRKKYKLSPYLTDLENSK